MEKEIRTFDVICVEEYLRKFVTPEEAEAMLEEMRKKYEKRWNKKLTWNSENLSD
jgi:uncharacterized protein YeeX (DUF496 family)